MRINTDDLDAELQRLCSLANIGSTSDADTEHLNDLFMEVLFMAERAQSHALNLAPRPEPDLEEQKRDDRFTAQVTKVTERVYGKPDAKTRKAVRR